MNKQYRKGYIFELKVKKYFEDMGLLCFRSAGSHSIADIILIVDTNIRPDTKRVPLVFLIQCKAGKGAISLAERKKLIATSKKHMCNSVIATSEKGKIKFKIYITKGKFFIHQWVDFDFKPYSKNVKMT